MPERYRAVSRLGLEMQEIGWHDLQAVMGRSWKRSLKQGPTMALS